MSHEDISVCDDHVGGEHVRSMGRLVLGALLGASH